MINSALFSIITVSLNNLAGLQKTALSLAAQSFDVFEWIVIDGHSNDGSIEFLKTTNAHWVSEKDSGIYDAMNKGIEKSSGMFLLFLNAGDVLADENVLADLGLSIEERSLIPDFIYGDALEESSHELNHYKPARAYRDLAKGMFTHHQAMIYRRAALDHLRYDTGYKIAGDYDFTCRFLQEPRNVMYWPHAVCVFERGGISQKNVALGREEQKNIKIKLGLCSAADAHKIAFVQRLSSALKKYLPWLYWALKTRQ